MTNQQKNPFFLNATTVFNILKTIPDNTRCFQTYDETSYQRDFVGTAKEILSAMDVNENTCEELMWNAQDKNAFLIELTLIREDEFSRFENSDRCCVLLVYKQKDQKPLGVIQIPRGLKL